MLTRVRPRASTARPCQIADRGRPVRAHLISTGEQRRRRAKLVVRGSRLRTVEPAWWKRAACSDSPGTSRRSDACRHRQQGRGRHDTRSACPRGSCISFPIAPARDFCHRFANPKVPPRPADGDERSAVTCPPSSHHARHEAHGDEPLQQDSLHCAAACPC